MSLMLGALALTSCNNLDSTFDAPKGNFSFKVSTDTRAGIDNNNVVWQANDTIALGAMVSGSNDTMAVAKAFAFAGDDTFTSNIDLDENQTYDFFAVYPYVASKNGGAFNMPNKLVYPDEYSNYLNVGGKSINQSGESMDGLMKFAPMYGTVSGKTPADLSIPMHHLAAMLDFKVVNTMDEPVTIKSLQMTTPEGKNICGTYYVAIDGSITPSGDNYVYNTSTVAVSDAKAIAKGETFHVYMPIAPVSLNAASKVEFKITADAGECVISKTLSKDVTFAAGTISTQTLNFAGTKIDYATIEDIIRNGAGNYTVKDVVVLGVSGSNAIVGDGTGCAIIYSKGLTGVAAGNTVELSGDVVAYQGVMEFNAPVITVTDNSTTINRGSAVAFGDTEIKAYASNPTIEYVKASGKMDDNRSVNFTNGYLWLYNENNSVGKYSDFKNKDVDVTGYTFGFQNKDGKTSVSFMITEIKEQGGVTPPTPVGNQYTWDLTQASYAQASEETTSWTSQYASVTNTRGGSSNTKTNNYLPPTNKSSRFYKNNIVTIAPGNGYSIKTIEFDATTMGYANAFKNSPWTNATATLRDSTVILTPADGSKDISATLGGTAGFKGITVYYENSGTPAKALTGITVNGQTTSFITGATFAFDGTCTATYEGGSTKVVTPTSVSSPDMSTAGTRTVTVTYTENGVTKTTQYTITVTANVSTGGKYVLVTSNAQLTSGQYLIVCESASVAFNGALTSFDAVNNNVAVTISGNSITATTSLKSAEFTYSSADGSFKGSSGKYFGFTKNDNGLTTSDTAMSNTVSVSSDGSASIGCSAGSYLRYNATSGQNRFRYYKSASYSNQQIISLYKYTE